MVDEKKTQITFHAGGRDNPSIGQQAQRTEIALVSCGSRKEEKIRQVLMDFSYTASEFSHSKDGS